MRDSRTLKDDIRSIAISQIGVSNFGRMRIKVPEPSQAGYYCSSDHHVLLCSQASETFQRILINILLMYVNILSSLPDRKTFSMKEEFSGKRFR